MMVVLAVTDRKNGPPPPGLVPIALFILILGIGASLGSNTGTSCTVGHTETAMNIRLRDQPRS